LIRLRKLIIENSYSVADPWNFVADPDGSCYFRQRPSRCQQIFFLAYFLLIYIIFLKIKKSLKISQNSRNQCFSSYFCLMILYKDLDSVTLTNGSGSGWPKSTRILRIRIRNTSYKVISVAILLTAAAAQEARPRDQVGVVAKLVVRGGIGRGRGARRCFVPRRFPTGRVAAAATATAHVQCFGNFCTNKKKYLYNWGPCIC
jgi:hypothetical protein